MNGMVNISVQETGLSDPSRRDTQVLLVGIATRENASTAAGNRPYLGALRR